MTNQNKFDEANEDLLNDILHEILLENENQDEPFSAAQLKFWTNKFPQFERELTDFFVKETLLSATPDEALKQEAKAVSEDKSFAAILQSLHREIGFTKDQATALTSLTDAATSKSLQFHELAARAELSISLLGNLEQRYAEFASIPKEIVGRLADALQVSVAAVTDYLRQPPQLVAGANYKSTEQPEVQQQADFFTLVRQDRMLTPEQKQELLKLENKPE